MRSPKYVLECDGVTVEVEKDDSHERWPITIRITTGEGEDYIEDEWYLDEEELATLAKFFALCKF